jgi:catechol 2,3-dioxygenase-like lactoylglutathione lyase family enzyme
LPIWECCDVQTAGPESIRGSRPEQLFTALNTNLFSVATGPWRGIETSVRPLNPLLRGIAFEEIRSKLFRMNVNDSALPKFQHVTITFSPAQEAELRGFYVGILGFREKPIPKVVKPLGWIWFDTGMPGVELHCVPDDEPVPANTRHHFCLEVDDLKRQREALIGAGFGIEEARPLPFRKRFFARDPFNNLIEFVHVEGDYVAAGEAAD